MKPVVAISLVASLAGVIASGESPSSIKREGNFWVYSVSGTLPVGTAQKFGVETAGNVVLKGESGSNASYKLKVRVQVHDVREATELFHQLSLKSGTQNGWAYLIVAPPRRITEAPELSVSVPRGLAQVQIETRGG